MDGARLSQGKRDPVHRSRWAGSVTAVPHTHSSGVCWRLAAGFHGGGPHAQFRGSRDGAFLGNQLMNVDVDVQTMTAESIVGSEDPTSEAYHQAISVLFANDK